MENKRVVITKTGEQNEIRCVKKALPIPKDYEVRIKVLLAGVSFGDILMRRGLYPNALATPFVPGYDVVGVVDCVGKNVVDYHLGDRVAALTILGGYSKYICLDVGKIVAIPDTVNTYKASALILNYLTAYQLLYRVAKVKSMDSIVIHGASGGVGSAMLDLAKNENVRIYGTASLKNKEKVSHFAEFIDYQNDDFVDRIRSEEKDGVDFVFDGVGGYNWKRSYQVLKKSGLFIGYGMTYSLNGKKSKQEQEFMQQEWQRIVSSHKTITNHRAEIFSITKIAQENPLIIREDLNTLCNLLQENRINPIISQIVPLDHVRHAHELFEQGGNGKILLMCNE